MLSLSDLPVAPLGSAWRRPDRPTECGAHAPEHRDDGDRPGVAKVGGRAVS